MAHERKCMVCGKEYRYCPRCDEFKGMPTWMFEFDKEECRKLYYDIVNPYAFKHITKEEAQNRLKDIDLSGYDLFPADIKKILDDLVETAETKMTEEKPKKKPVFKSNKEED